MYRTKNKKINCVDKHVIKERLFNTIEARNKEASATREVMTTLGLYFSRHSTIGAAPKYMLIPCMNHRRQKKGKSW